MTYTLHHGDCLDVLRTMPDNSVDAVVTDPPYGLSFMGKRWDYDVPSEDVWAECLRVLKPGGHLLAFAGTRTQHRMAVRIEDAGFEIRDMIAWVYGSGFPKSMDVSKAIDKAAGVEREIVGQSHYAANRTALKPPIGTFERTNDDRLITAPATDAAKHWHGWGTALKPALEPITVARKPLIGTVAENVLTWGTGGVNVDGCRVGSGGVTESSARAGKGAGYEAHNKEGRKYGDGLGGVIAEAHPLGRWPANLIHDGSEEVVGLFPETKSGAGARRPNGAHSDVTYNGGWSPHDYAREADSGSAARFFYCAKASKRDRDEGCEGMEAKTAGGMQERNDGSLGSITLSRNHHPTVKPTDLMRYLCRLVTPPGGTVLDPFMGSGSTGKAAIIEDFNFIGIEREAEYLDIARARIEHAINNKPNKLL